MIQTVPQDCYTAQMPKFFDTLDNMRRFLSRIDQEKCPACQNANLLVLHSWVYKQTSSQQRQIVGKRLWCSPRYQRGGCGASHRLYLQERVPGLHYLAAHLTIFVAAFIATGSVPKAYRQATGSSEPRNAYRWLARMRRQQGNYRTQLGKPAAACRPQSLQHRVVLETLCQLKSCLGDRVCEMFQQHCQKPFI